MTLLATPLTIAEIESRASLAFDLLEQLWPSHIKTLHDGAQMYSVTDDGVVYLSSDAQEFYLNIVRRLGSYDFCASSLPSADVNEGSRNPLQ